MSKQIPVREGATNEDNDVRLRSLTTISESAVRRDGTIQVKVAEEGWGSSGYYDRSVLESAVPAAFPSGTQMFWNHDTPTEEAERPEGDLNRLAAVTINEPYWDDSGVNGAGMYADALIRNSYAEALNEIADWIGVSMRANGTAVVGEADGRRGRIITSIAPSPLNRIDFVTKPGAGGKVVSIFEAAGRAAKVREGMTHNSIHERLTGKLRERFGRDGVYLWIKDFSESDGWVVFEESGEAENKFWRVGFVASDNDVQIADDDPQEVVVTTTFEPVVSIGESAATTPHGGDPVEKKATKDSGANVAISEAAQRQIDAQSAEIAKLRESLVLRDARDIARGRINSADLPNLTATRLLRESLRHVPTDEHGAIDETAFGDAVDGLIKEAKAEIAALTGSGDVTGHGATAPTPADEIDVEAVNAKLSESLGRLGYGG